MWMNLATRQSRSQVDSSIISRAAAVGSIKRTVDNRGGELGQMHLGVPEAGLSQSAAMAFVTSTPIGIVAGQLNPSSTLLNLEEHILQLSWQLELPSLREVFGIEPSITITPAITPTDEELQQTLPSSFHLNVDIIALRAQIALADINQSDEPVSPKTLDVLSALASGRGPGSIPGWTDVHNLTRSAQGDATAGGATPGPGVGPDQASGVGVQAP